MKYNKLFITTILILTLFSSCKKDNNSDPGSELTPAIARDSLYSIMNEWYLWYDLMPSVNKNNYADPYELMEAMKYKPLDRYSFVADYDQFMAQMQGSFVGHGFSIGLDDADNARIVQIFSRSALYAEGVRRGWIVKKINNTEVAPVLKSGDPSAYSNLIGPSEAGITNNFLFITPEGAEKAVTATKSSFTLNSVILYDTLHLSSGITGHLVFDSFISPSDAELATAFSYFESAGISDLILDLRYNSGGYLYIAQILASYIAGNDIRGSHFVKLKYNDQHPERNTTFLLLNTAHPIGLSRLVVITSRETASASEAIINGLKPYMEVVTIGDTTFGKPTGMDGGDIGRKYFIAPVTFTSVNKNDEGDYFNGFAPSAIVPDDITHDYDSREELCLKSAINYLETGSAGTKGIAPFKKHPRFSEKKEWMRNMFVLEN